MAKKRATGMSKRLGFTDRQTIAENKDILRYNERLEREAKGLPAERAERSGPSGPGRHGPARGARTEGPSRAERPAHTERPARPVRPPALTDEEQATLRDSYAVAVGESGLDAAAERVVTRLAAHDGFERASGAGWELASGGHAEERTAEQWALLRTAWLAVRLALLEAYATIKPEAQPALERERKQQARAARQPRGRAQRPHRAKAVAPRAGGDSPATDGADGADGPDGSNGADGAAVTEHRDGTSGAGSADGADRPERGAGARPRRSRGSRGRGKSGPVTPSPADIARRVHAAGHAGASLGQIDAGRTDRAPEAVGPPEGGLPSMGVLSPELEMELGQRPELSAAEKLASLESPSQADQADAHEASGLAEDDPPAALIPQETVDGEHEGYRPTAPSADRTADPVIDDDQMTLGF